MAKLQCEICGGKLVGKPGGVFECENCGMEFSKEWAQEKIQEIKGTVKIEWPVEVTGSVKVEGGVNKESLLKRGMQALEDKDWTKAWKCFEQVLDIDPECAEGYLGKAQAEWSVADLEKTDRWTTRVDKNKSFQCALQYGDDALREKLNGLINAAEEARRQEERRLAESKVSLKPVRERIAPLQGLIAASDDHTVGVRSDGTVVAVGDNRFGQCDLSGWKDIAAVAAGGGHTVGLRADGTVVAVGLNKGGQCNVSAWRNIVAIAAALGHTIGLKSDGTVVAVGHNDKKECNVSRWDNIVAISTGMSHTVGLQSNGKASAEGENEDKQCDVILWKDIVAVAAGSFHTVGLRSDGTVVAVGSHYNGESKVSDWRDIAAIAVGYRHTVGLKSDGTVVAVGKNDDGQCDVSDWRDIVAIAAGDYHTVGLRSDGTLVTAGKNDKGQCDVSDWKLFKSVDTIKQEYREAKIATLTTERTALQTELASLKGLFTGKRRREIEARLADIDAELSKL